MPAPFGCPVVHLELRTGDPARACDFYTSLFGWWAETTQFGAGSYLTLGRGLRIEIGVVEQASEHPWWLPYVEVAGIDDATDRARLLGAAVPLAPREGPAGWRSVIAAPAGGEIGLWQPKP